MSVLPNPGTPRRRILTPYVILWMAIASFALAYLALLGLRPHMFASAARTAPDIEQKLAQTKREVERSLADLDPLRRTVGEVKMDVANLKVAAQEASARDQTLMEKVAALETAPPKTAEPAHAASPAPRHRAAMPPPPTPKPNKAAGAKPFMPPVGPSAEETRTHAAQKSAKLINGAQTQKGGGIETGSIQRPARPTTVPPAVKSKTAAKSLPVGVILATGPSLDTLRLNWSILTDRHPDAIRNLHPRYVVTGKAPKRTYGLIAGPVASTADAESLCKVMESRGLPCTVGIYRGKAL